LLLLAAAGIAIYLANREPSYNGRTLSSWLKEIGSDADDVNLPQAQEAIRQMGSHALPYLLKELRRKDSPAKRKLMELNARFDHSLVDLPPAEYRRGAAREALRALGSKAAPIIPELSLNLTDNELADESAMALAYIGQPALPAIKEHVISTNYITRSACVMALLEFTNVTEVAFTFQKLASDNQWRVRSMAAHGMGRFPLASEISVPILVNLLSDTNPFVQRSACRGIAWLGTNALLAVPALSNIYVSTPHNDKSLRRITGWALRQTCPTSVPFFLTLLTHTNSEVRAESVCRLASVRDDATNHIPEILSLRHDPDARVRQSVIEAIHTIQAEPDQFIPALSEAIRLEQDETVLQPCLALLEQFGSAASNALPALIEQAQRSSGEPRLLLEWTIATINGNAAKALGVDALTIANAQTTFDARTNSPIAPTRPPTFVPPPPP